MLISRIEWNQSMKEQGNYVFGQVLTFKIGMCGLFWKVLEKINQFIDRKARHYFFTLSTKRRCCSFSMSVKTGSKSTGSEKMEILYTVQNSLIICIGTGTNVLPDRKVEQGWVFSRQILSQRSLNWADTDMGTETSDSQGWKLRKRHRGSLGFWTLVWDVSSEQRPNYKAEVVVGVYFTRSKCKYKM